MAVRSRVAVLRVLVAVVMGWFLPVRWMIGPDRVPVAGTGRVGMVTGAAVSGAAGSVRPSPA
ncbi:hypothetical protein GCM10025734_83160 [Kitasatospora paranensis]